MMKTTNRTGPRKIIGATIAALTITIGLVAAPGAALAADDSQVASAETSSSLIQGPLIDLGDLMNLIGSINIGQFQ